MTNISSSAGFLLPKRVVTVSPIGVAATGLTNGGADYGVDTLVGGFPSLTSGIQEAINSLSPLGGTVFLLPGTFQIKFYVDTNGVSNLTIELHPEASIAIPASPSTVNSSWPLPANTIGGSTRSPAILVRNGSHVRIRGGILSQGTSGTVDNNVTGVWIAGIVEDVEVRDVLFSTISRFAVLINGYVGVGGGQSGTVSNIRVTDCEMDGCGTFSVIDGGGVRCENATPSGLTIQGIWIERNFINGTNFFGVDVGGGGELYTINSMFVRRNLIVSAPSGQSGVGIKFEGQVGAGALGSVVGGQISDNHVIGMGNQGIMVSPAVSFVNILGNLVEGCYFDGIVVYGGTGANTHISKQIVISDNVTRNNSQQTAGSYAGIAILTSTAANATTIQDVLIVGNACNDDQGTATQTIGIRLVCSVSTATIKNVRVSQNDCPVISGPSISIALTSGVFSNIVVKDNLGFNPDAPVSLTGQTSGVAIATRTVDAWTNETFRIDAYALISSGNYTSGSFKIQVGFTDENGHAQTSTITVVSGGALPALSVNAVGAWAGLPIVVRAQAGTSITVSTSGAFVATYNCSAAIIMDTA